MDVGFVGLGNMGQSMARNLLRAGHRVTVYNRTRSRGGGKRRQARGTCRNDSPGAARTVGPTGFLRRHVVRSASREGSAHGPQRESPVHIATPRQKHIDRYDRPIDSDSIGCDTHEPDAITPEAWKEIPSV